MPNFGGTYVSPFYNTAPEFVRTELLTRAADYGSRIRSLAPTETRDRGAERLLWSYGKIAWARVYPQAGPPLGTANEKLMSNASGKLILYDQARNVPNRPLLQSVEITSEGTMGSLMKATINFIVFPPFSTKGFKMSGIEDGYLKPGKELRIQWGWSVRGNSANRGEMQGIIYNFEWSVNPDLSIAVKTSVVSKGSIALGISGEQHNPDATGGVQDPLGNEVYDTDLVGILEKDVISKGGVKNTKVTLSPGSQVATEAGTAPFVYTILAIPRSLRDADQDLLSDDQKEKQEADKAAQEIQEKKNAALLQFADEVSKLEQIASDLFNKINKARENNQETVDGQDIDDVQVQQVAAYDAYTAKLQEAIDASGTSEWWLPDVFNKSVKEFEGQLKTQAAKIRASRQQGQTAQADAQVYKTETPEPIAEPTYYVPLWQLAGWFNKKLGQTKKELGSITSVQVKGNITQYLGEVVSCTPDKVYFPDSTKGAYGEFKPFTNTMKLGDGNIDIGDILISTTCIAETYREFLKENQTNITYKNITGFWDALIKKVNYASGETYQLTVRVVEGPSIGRPPSDPSILSIEDSNIPTSVSATPVHFDANISNPILKNINISSKPPGPLAAAAFANARGGGSKQLDVKIDKSGDAGELSKAKSAITTTTSQMIKTGVSDKWSQDLKGAYATYKRAQSEVKDAHWLNKAIYPVNLTLTIDGINGFHFGNVLTTSLVPSQYNKEKLVFVVTKVAHSIKDGVWETTLETRSRIG